MTKKPKAVQSRDADESLEKAKKAFASPPKVEDSLPPKPGQTIVERAAPSGRPRTAKLQEVELKSEASKRSKLAYEISRSAPSGDAIDRGDLSGMDAPAKWRIASDKQIMLNGRSVRVLAGTVITNLTHDLNNLREIGVVLERVR